MILHKIWNKCKSREFFAILIVLGVGLASFGLGRLSVLDILQNCYPQIIYDDNFKIQSKVNDTNKNESKSIFYESIKNETNLTASPALSEGGLVVASKSGKKYHFPWCAGAKAISEENRIWFKSIDEARLAGYKPASNCKGLK